MFTFEGYVIPSDFSNGLPYTPMGAYTDEDFEELPQVIMTSDHTWDPTIHNLSDDSAWYENISDFLEEISDSPFNDTNR